jgi:hypothetical protein
MKIALILSAAAMLAASASLAEKNPSRKVRLNDAAHNNAPIAAKTIKASDAPLLADSAKTPKELWQMPDNFVVKLPDGQHLTIADARKLMKPSDDHAEMDMLRLQSVVSQRATALQQTTEPLNKANEAQAAVARNLGSGGGKPPVTPAPEVEQAPQEQRAPEALPETADLTSTLDGIWFGNIMSGSGSAQSTVAITITRVGPNIIKITSDSKRLPEVTVPLQSTPQGQITARLGDTAILYEPRRNPPTLEVNFRQYIEWLGIR